MLAGIDTVVIDLQDVGARYYTFVWTAVLALTACAAAGVPVVLLDRPNPLGGIRMEGNLPTRDSCPSWACGPCPRATG